MVRTAVVAIALSLSCAAQDWSLEKLYTRPYVWGTPPSHLEWSRKGHTLVFLWNAAGRRFLDLYAYHPGTRKLVRLTNLEAEKDELNVTEEEKDARLRPYRMPPAGLGEFDVAQDGARVAFSYKGDLYIVSTDGAQPPFRLTRTKAVESSPQFSPNGRQLAYTRAGVLYVQDLAGGAFWQATDIESDAGSLSAYRWSRDGRYFVYMVRRGTARQTVVPNYSGRFVAARPFPRSVAGDDPPKVAFYIVPSSGGPAQALEVGASAEGEYSGLPEWSPDSTKLLARVTQAGMKRQRVLVLDRATGKARVLHQEADPKWVNRGSACWSPDSRWVLFSSEQDGWSHLY